jgi:hypothetical protein
MKVIKLLTDGRAILADVPNELEELQKAVGGYIETVSRAGFVLVCDEEGRLKGKPDNETASRLVGISIVGDALVCGVLGYNFTDLSSKAVALIEDFLRVNFMRVLEVEE